MLGKGDMLFMSSANRIVRIHGPYVSEQEIEKITNSLRAQGEPDYMEEITSQETTESSLSPGNEGDEDELFNQAVEIIKSRRKSIYKLFTEKITNWLQ